MRRGVRVCAVLLLVLIGGCSGLVGDASRPVVSVTPAAVPDDEPPYLETASSVDARQGARFKDPTAMAGTHRSVLTNTSYTVISTQTVRFPEDDRTGRWHLTGRFGGDGRFLVETVRNGSVFGTGEPVRIAFFSDGERVVEAFVSNRSTTANVVLDVRGNPVRPLTVLPIDPRFEGELTRVFASTAITSVERVQHAGGHNELVRVTAAGPIDPDNPPSLELTTAVRNLTARLVIDERGFVQAYDLRYTGSFAGQPVVVIRSVTYRAVGTTDVDRPAWATVALNGSATTGYGTSSGTNGSS